MNSLKIGESKIVFAEEADEKTILTRVVPADWRETIPSIRLKISLPNCKG